MSQQSPVIEKRYDFVYLFDVQMGNPNGDPDLGNAPRMDPRTGLGYVTDGSIKRKIRDFVSLAVQGGLAKPDGNAIYVERGSVLQHKHEAAAEAAGLVARDPNAKRQRGKGSAETDAENMSKAAVRLSGMAKAQEFVCQHYYDVRAFGAVLAGGENLGGIRGPVQIDFGVSVDRIDPWMLSITRTAVATEDEAQSQVQKGGFVIGTMGNKALTPYGLYRVTGSVSPFDAKRTGFSEADLDLLWLALDKMMDQHRTSSSGLISPRGLIVFEHESAFGNAHRASLFESVIIRRRDGVESPRAFSDYTVELPTSLPRGVRLLQPGTAKLVAVA